MSKVILTMNAGSSSLKFGAFRKSNTNKLDLKKILSGQISKILSDKPEFILKDESGKIVKDCVLSKFGADAYKSATELIMEEISLDISSTAHRIVHGGDEFKQSTLINEDILKRLEKYIPLAALHQPYNLKIASLFLKLYPNLQHYVCFDTAFHQTMDPVARAYAIPAKYADEGIKRYGFHGLSYQYVSGKLLEYVGEEAANKKWIIAHLGSGSSLCAMYKQKSVATTMGFSVLEGLPMGTRCGRIDPAVITYLERRDNLGPEEINNILYNHSGLLGLSGGISNDIKTLLASGDLKAKFAIDVFCHQVVLSLGEMVAAVGGCDGIIFTAGVGENSSVIRENICNKLAWLNIKIDPNKNKNNEASINVQNSIPVLVVPTNEEYIMAMSAYTRIGA